MTVPARAQRQRSSTLTIILFALALIVAITFLSRLVHHGETPAQATAAMKAGCSQVTAAFERHQSGYWLTVAAPVSRVLADAHGAATHQRFILRCPKETILVENNVDIGRRAPVSVGERVGAQGQYIWNALGGLIHDTHHATNSTTPSGWVYVAGHVYQ